MSLVSIGQSIRTAQGDESEFEGHVTQVSRLPEQVERFAKSVETRFVATAEMLVRTAEKLEARAEDLRSKARWLLEQRGLANDIREAVTFEQTSMDEVKSLALVDVGMRHDSSAEGRCPHGIPNSVHCNICDN